MESIKDFIIQISFSFPSYLILAYLVVFALLKFLLLKSNKLSKRKLSSIANLMAVIFTLSLKVFAVDQISAFDPNLSTIHPKLQFKVTTQGVVFFPKEKAKEPLRKVIFEEKAILEVSKKLDSDLIIYSCNSLKLRECLNKIIDPN